MVMQPIQLPKSSLGMHNWSSSKWMVHLMWLFLFL
jgi:hypothetical protein